jgi:putative peptide zinc metalloprotease protein
VFAPRRGVVIGLPTRDQLGKFWDKDERRPFCSIGDPNKLRALVPVSPDEYELLKRDQEALKKEGRDLEATIRVQGRGPDTWKGRLGPLPHEEVKNLPTQLTTRGGGPIAIKPAAPNSPNVPQTQMYLISVNFIDPDVAVFPGTMAQVKIHCRWQTCRWWAWRALNNAFDLKLL